MTGKETEHRALLARPLSGHTRPGMWLIWLLLAFVAVAIVTVVAVLVWATVFAGPASDTAGPATEPSSSATDGTSKAPAPSASETTGKTDADPADDPSAALEALKGIEVVDGEAELNYDRGQFGQAWLDVDRNGCDTRNDILGRDLLDPVFKDGTRDCKVLSGTLIDPYSGESVAFVSGQNTSVLVQIDHVVPLAWAWRHGAEDWTMDLRAEFANDPRNLLASSQGMNQGKGASGPSNWLPPVRDLQCGYAEKWVGMLDAYDLGISVADRATLDGVLRGC